MHTEWIEGKGSACLLVSIELDDGLVLRNIIRFVKATFAFVTGR